jgi:hypothetical protein
MLDGFDHAFRHPVALWPLWCSALVLYSIIFAHGIELCTPFPSVVSKNELRNSIPANQIILQKSCNNLGSMVSYCLGFAPLRIVVDSHQDIFVT